MKKFLATLSAVGFFSIFASTGLSNFSQTNLITQLEKNEGLSIDTINKSNKYDAAYTWSDIRIDHSAQTPAAGIHQDSKDAYDAKGSGKSWEDFFMKSKWVIASGYFALHTYTDPEYFSESLLYINEKESNDLKRVWEFKKTNDQWQGWGHHTSTIHLTATAEYDPAEEITTLRIKSNVYARTAAAVHKCSTTSQIKTLVFVEGAN